jgi:tetratricopeptide (TPR) repeat protein
MHFRIRSIAILLFLTWMPVTLAGPATLAEARKQWLRGKYEEARLLYDEVIRQNPKQDAAAIGLSKALESQGSYDRALAAVETALGLKKDSADLHARRAELLYFRGRWQDADASIARALELAPDHFLARWLRARLFADRGDLTRADAEFRWFVRTYTAHSDADREITDPEALLLIGQAGCQNARWNNLSDQFQFIVNEIYPDALKADKNFWPAEYEAGLVFLEKYNRADALEAFDRALAINPRAAEALVGKGMVALQHFEIQSALRYAEQALAVNPHSPQALVLRADIHVLDGDTKAARRNLDHARRISPSEETILGRLAACAFLEHRDKDLEALQTEVRRRDAKPAQFHLAMAEALESRRLFTPAERAYKKAAEFWPMLSEAPGALGLLYMRDGREAEARPLLMQAFDADRFNVRVRNTLTVLQHLDQYTTTKTPHFEIRYDQATDKLLAAWLADYLEKTYRLLAKQYDYELRRPVLLELFNDHEMFSGRVTGLPDLHTIGASTGRVVAMASPHAKGSRPFNWARVVRHELVHVFNLEQTNFQVPHWLTEGLAVRNEGFPRPQEWNELLQECVQGNQLMTLKTIDLGFVRPRGPREWAQAYCQAELYVEYSEAIYGGKTPIALLGAYADGMNTEQAILMVCKVDLERFEERYREYVRSVLEKLHLPVTKSLSLPQLQDAHARNPADMEIAAKLALAFIDRRRNDEAQALAEAVLAKKPAHPLASLVKARLLLAAGDDEEARALLEKALAPGSPEPQILMLLGKLCRDSGNCSRAAELFELGRRLQPYQKQWLAELVTTYAQAGERDKEILVLKELVRTDGEDITQRKKLAELLSAAGRPAEAETYARQALEIDVLDVDAEKELADALLGQRKWHEAAAVYRTVLDLDMKSNDARLKLARAYLESGDAARADAELSRVLAGDPENSEARTLLKRLHR